MAQETRSPEPARIVEETQKLANDARHLYDTVRTENPIGYYYQKNPYAVLAAAAGVGYILGGGLFTPFTRRLIKVGFKTMALPIAAAQLRELAQGVTGDDISIGEDS